MSPSPNATAEHMDPSARAHQAVIVIWTLFAVGVCVTCLRTYSRIKMVGVKRLQPDDYLVWLALVFYACQTALGYQVGHLAHGLANNAMTDEQRAALSPDDPEYAMRVLGSKIQIAGWTIYSTLVTVLKLAMAVFFLRLTSALGRTYRIRVYVGFGLIVAGYVASIIAIFSSCRSLSKSWQIYPDPGRFCYPATSPSVVWTSFVSNVLSDVYLILIPIPLLWSSRLRFLEKALSTVVLGAGVFVLACVGVKTGFILTNDVNGPEQAGAWGTREAFVAVVVTNLPMVFPLIKSALRPLLGSWLESRHNGRSTGPYKMPGSGVVDFQVRTIGGGDPSTRTRKGRRSNANTRSTARRSTIARRTRNIMTYLSFAYSEERIVMEEGKLEGMEMGMGGMIAQAVQVEIGVGDAEQGVPSNGAGDGHISSRTAGMVGIVVSSEIEVFEDSESARHHRTAGAHEP